MRKLLFLIFIFSWSFSEAQFHISFGQECYGVFMSDTVPRTDYFLGTGFAIDSDVVITCYHVFRDSPNRPKYFDNTMGRRFPITLIDSFPAQDIAVFKTSYRVTGRPFKIDGFRNLNIGDSIFYMGYDLIKKEHYGSIAIVTNRDSIVNKGFLIKRISFNGTAIGGYSGGPVFAKDGKVIALVTIAVVRRNDGQTISTVGYSVEPLLKQRF